MEEVVVVRGRRICHRSGFRADLVPRCRYDVNDRGTAVVVTGRCGTRNFYLFRKDVNRVMTAVLDDPDVEVVLHGIEILALSFGGIVLALVGMHSSAVICGALVIVYVAVLRLLILPAAGSSWTEPALVLTFDENVNAMRSSMLSHNRNTMIFSLPVMRTLIHFMKFCHIFSGQG